MKRVFGIALCLFFAAASAVNAQPVLQNADILSANVSTASGTVIFNNGDGTFTRQPDLNVGGLPVAVEAADLNEDGNIDLVYINGGRSGEHALSFLFGNPDGTFRARTAFSLGFESSNGVAIGDFNNDHHWDILVPNWFPGGQVEILTGDGHGNFTAGSPWPVQGRANNVASGDFNHDGKLDGVVCNWDNGKVTILYGDGNGGFSRDQQLDAGGNPQSVEVSDLDKDGDDDLVFSHGSSQFLTVYFNHNNDGTFERQDIPAIVQGPGGPSFVRLGDFNNDGYADLFTFQEISGAWSLSVFLWDAAHHAFNSQVTTPVENLGGIPNGLEVADFNSDGNLDAVIGNLSAGKISVYPGSGDGHFNVAQQQDIVINTAAVGLAVANINEPPAVEAGDNHSMSTAQQNSTVLHGQITDHDGDSLSYRWLEGTFVLKDWASVGLNGIADLNLAGVPPLSVGEHTLTLEGNDAKTSASDTMILTVNNSSPVVAPGGGGTVQLGSPIVLQGQVADFDGNLLTYKWLEGSFVLTSGSISTLPGGAPLALPSYTIPGGLPLGVHVITLAASDGTNPEVSEDITITVIDTTAPTVQPSVNPGILWPPNHKMVDVTINANATDNSGPVLLAAAVSSSEPAEVDNHGDPIPDFTTPVIDQATGVITLQLRAERNGQGSGRTYTITITATDASHNSSTAVVQVVAPHDRGH